MVFNDMALEGSIKTALAELKFTEPTSVQEKVLPLAIEGQDLIVCAETGAGKTAAFGIPMLQRLIQSPESKGLILAPTRELAMQICEFLLTLTSHTNKMNVVALVGGMDMRKQLGKLKKNPRIIVATPGRLIDHLERKSVKLNTVETLVLDEGDRMLDMGFAPQLDAILKHLPANRQTMLFTATLSREVKKLSASYLNEPNNISVGRASLPVASVHQSIVQVEDGKAKDEQALNEINAREGQIIIFVKTQRKADQLAKYLLEYGVDVTSIHGGKTQGQRNKAIQRFRDNDARVLCATDVAARGIDIPAVRHVINYDLPRQTEDYVHRIGRTARNGASGQALSFVTPADQRTWQMIVRTYQIKGADVVKGNFKGRTRGGDRGNSSGVSRGNRSERSGRGDSVYGKDRKRFSRNEGEGSREDSRPARWSFEGEGSRDGSRPERRRFDGEKREGSWGSKKRFEGEGSRDGSRPERKRFDGEKHEGSWAPKKRFEGEGSRDGSRPERKRFDGEKREGSWGSKKRFEGEGSRDGSRPERKRFDGEKREGSWGSKKRFEGEGSRDGSRPERKRFDGEKREGSWAPKKRFDGEGSSNESRSFKRSDDDRRGGKSSFGKKTRSFKSSDDQGGRGEKRTTKYSVKKSDSSRGDSESSSSGGWAKAKSKKNSNSLRAKKASSKRSSFSRDRRD